MHNGLTKIYKLGFLAQPNGCVIKKEIKEVLQETNKTYKIEESGVINKTKINVLRVARFKDTHNCFARSAWATAEEVEKIAHEFKIKANDHFNMVIKEAQQTQLKIREAYHGK